MGKTSNQKRFFVLRSIGKRVGLEVNRNFNGDYSYRELKGFARKFNASTSSEIRTRVSCLQALFSAKILAEVSVTEKGEYVPETIADLEKVFRGDEAEKAAFFLKKRIRVHDPYIVGYHPKTGDPSIDGDDKSRWNRAWIVHVKNIRRLEIKKGDDRECLLLIVLHNDPGGSQ